jgi:hypothetical protein
VGRKVRQKGSIVEVIAEKLREETVNGNRLAIEREKTRLETSLAGCIVVRLKVGHEFLN